VSKNSLSFSVIAVEAAIKAIRDERKMKRMRKRSKNERERRGRNENCLGDILRD